MASRFDERLAAVRGATEDPGDPGNRRVLLSALAGKSGILIAAVANGVASADDALAQCMVQAFERLLDDPAKRDPQCHGKVAIVKALYRDNFPSDDLFLRGIRHVQMEPVWGGSVDTAAEVRGTCGMALAYRQHPRAMVELGHLLADREPGARIAAARALAASGNRAVAEPLLRLRVEAGEDEPGVVGACLGALLELAPDDSLAYVASYLDTEDDAVAEATALALGESRLEGAFSILRDHAESLAAPGRRGVVLLSLALLRSDQAWDHLVGLIESDSIGIATEAAKALATFGHDERLRARVRAAVEKRADAALAREIDELFG